MAFFPPVTPMALFPPVSAPTVLVDWHTGRSTTGDTAYCVAREHTSMFEWVRRETAIDVFINVVPIILLAYFLVLTLTNVAWRGVSRTVVVAHFLTVFPILVLAIATYVVARAIESDIQRR